MSRLLFAAARGARIYPNSRPTVRVNLMWINDAVDHGMSYHIHPEDAHLAYGPLSTGLRNVALGLEPTESCWFTNYSIHSDGFIERMSKHECSLFLLLMAEGLADEGL